MKPHDELRVIKAYTTGSISLKVNDIVILCSGSDAFYGDNTRHDYWVGQENSGSFWISKKSLEKTGRNLKE
jgi:hypothetical protein